MAFTITAPIFVLADEVVEAGQGNGLVQATIEKPSENGLIELAPTPPMGWNSWNAFEVNIDETKIMAMADAMVRSGMRDAGYIPGAG